MPPLAPAPAAPPADVPPVNKSSPPALVLLHALTSE
jgi:hypothetical protein